LQTFFFKEGVIFNSALERLFMSNNAGLSKEILEEFHFGGYNVEQSVESQRIFWRNMSLPSSWFDNEQSKNKHEVGSKLLPASTGYMISENINLHKTIVRTSNSIYISPPSHISSSSLFLYIFFRLFLTFILSSQQELQFEYTYQHIVFVVEKFSVIVIS
jgi:hypothetical protein